MAIPSSNSSGPTSRSAGPSDALSDFVLKTRGEPWVPGWSDCGSWVARWVAETRPAALGLLCPSHDQAEVDRFVAEAGGLIALMVRSAAAAGLMPNCDPKRGDIAAVFPADDVEVAAIWSGRRWLIKTARGVVSVPATLFVAWSL